MIADQPSDSGSKTLFLLSNAHSLNAWIFERIQAYLHSPVIEIGSGIGNISKFLSENCDELVLSDFNEDYIGILKKNFSERKQPTLVESINLLDLNFDGKFNHLKARFNSLLLINVLEHLSDDEYAIKNALSLIKPGGKLIVLVPNAPCLYNKLDKNLGHVRRYSMKALKTMLKDIPHLKLEMSFFNAIGTFAWFVSGHLLHSDTIKKWQVTLFEYMVPFGKIVDRLINYSFGLSIIAIIEKEKLH